MQVCHKEEKKRKRNKAKKKKKRPSNRPRHFRAFTQQPTLLGDPKFRASAVVANALLVALRR